MYALPRAPILRASHHMKASDKEYAESTRGAAALVLAVSALVMIGLFWFIIPGLVGLIVTLFFQVNPNIPIQPLHHPRLSSMNHDLPNCPKRVIGYYTEFESTDITRSQLGQVTHAVFAYVEMNYDGSIRFKSERAEERFLSLTRKSKATGSKPKVMISIGGEENSQYFAKVANDSRKRGRFVNSIANFIKEYEINGVDLYWKRATENDKRSYELLLKEIREKLETMGTHTISITIPAALVDNWEVAYNLTQTLEYVDFINVFSMDYYGPWPNQWGSPAGPTAPLYSGVGEKKNFNVDATMKFYVCSSKQPERFNIVIPFFARLWKNVRGPVAPGKEVYRKVELKDNKAEGSPYMSRWTVDHEKWDLSNSTWDEASKSSYIYDQDKDIYLSFETQKSIEAKMAYVKEKNLGGVWIWSVDMDNEENSLLNGISSYDSCSRESKKNLQYKC